MVVHFQNFRIFQGLDKKIGWGRQVCAYFMNLSDKIRPVTGKTTKGSKFFTKPTKSGSFEMPIHFIRIQIFNYLFNNIETLVTIYILNYFKNRSTNVSAESFNAKIKTFRSQLEGVKNIQFFLYRLTTIFM
ncbi:transposase [Sinomicrobium sp. M5D2P9]